MKNISKILTILLLILSIESCHKKKIQSIIPDPIPIICESKTSGEFEGKYYHTFNNPPYPEYTDTIIVKFTKGDCNSTEYRIDSLSKAYSDYGIPTDNRSYYISINEQGTGAISDTLTAKFNYNGALLSVKYDGYYNNLSFIKVK